MDGKLLEGVTRVLIIHIVLKTPSGLSLESRPVGGENGSWETSEDRGSHAFVAWSPVVALEMESRVRFCCLWHFSVMTLPQSGSSVVHRGNLESVF